MVGVDNAYVVNDKVKFLGSKSKITSARLRKTERQIN